MLDNKEQRTETFYVGTLAAYVLVDTTMEETAAELGETQLRELYSERLGVRPEDVPLEIRVVRPATEVELARESNL